MKKLFASTLALLFLGCLDYTTVTEIEPDGSGSLSCELKIPIKEGNEISFEGFKTRLDSTPGWKTNSFVVDTLDSVQRLRLTGEFASPVEITNPILDWDFMGFSPDSVSFTSEKIATGYRYRYYKSFGWDENRDVKISIDLPDDDEGFVWREELILPGRILSHNADDVKGVKLIWERSTADVLKKGLVIEATWEVDS
ncbi:hypothetical protein JXM67_03110 [candidate division WOR-3 bacterium]|nr:hypothetical protein [candidate division WOR-3 bacterium]